MKICPSVPNLSQPIQAVKLQASIPTWL